HRVTVVVDHGLGIGRRITGQPTRLVGHIHQVVVLVDDDGLREGTRLQIGQNFVAGAIHHTGGACATVGHVYLVGALIEGHTQGAFASGDRLEQLAGRRIQDGQRARALVRHEEAVAVFVVDHVHRSLPTGRPGVQDFARSSIDLDDVVQVHVGNIDAVAVVVDPDADDGLSWIADHMGHLVGLAVDDPHFTGRRIGVRAATLTDHRNIDQVAVFIDGDL